MGRDRILPYRIFGYVHPRLGTPIYSVLLMGGVHLIGALLLKYTEAAELVNFGAFIGFMLVNLCVVRHYWLRQEQRGRPLANLILPLLGGATCLYIWLHLSNFALGLGGVWLALGLLYLLALTRGLSRKIVELKLEVGSEK
jgi:putrescine importer